MTSYTPPLSTSFSSRRSGPPSGRSQAAPVDDMLRSVAAKIMAPPTRSIGTRGIPAIATLCSIFKRPVSVHLFKTIYSTRKCACHVPVKNGWMTATRIFFCASGWANDRPRARTPDLVAEYIGAFAAACQEAVHMSEIRFNQRKQSRTYPSNR